ncbi:MAG: hypothetical protein AABP62_04610 [Planctomycetota bacterium]
MLKQYTIRTTVSTESIGESAIKISRRKPHPMQSVRGLFRRAEMISQIQASFFDLCGSGKELLPIIGRRLTASPRPYDIWLDGDQERRASKHPSETVCFGSKLLRHRSRGFAHDGDRWVGIGRVWFSRQEPNPNRIVLANFPLQRRRNLVSCQSNQHSRTGPRRIKDVLFPGPSHTLLK